MPTQAGIAPVAPLSAAAQRIWDRLAPDLIAYRSRRVAPSGAHCRTAIHLNRRIKNLNSTINKRAQLKREGELATQLINI